jgi:hypothetical protein
VSVRNIYYNYHYAASVSKNWIDDFSPAKKNFIFEESRSSYAKGHMTMKKKEN